MTDLSGAAKAVPGILQQACLPGRLFCLLADGRPNRLGTVKNAVFCLLRDFCGQAGIPCQRPLKTAGAACMEDIYALLASMRPACHIGKNARPSDFYDFHHVLAVLINIGCLEHQVMADFAPAAENRR